MATVTRRVPSSARLLTVVLGAGASAALGALAALVRPDHGWSTFAVFTGVALGPCLGLAWTFLVSDHVVDRDPHREDDVESRWLGQASSGALGDVVIAAGVSLLLVSILHLDVDAVPVLTGVLLLAFADTAARYLLLRRRGA